MCLCPSQNLSLERSNMERFLKSIVAGIAVSVILQVSAATVAELVYGCCTGPRGDTPLWYAVLSPLLHAIVGLAPGFLTAWLYARKGILLGSWSAFWGMP